MNRLGSALRTMLVFPPFWFALLAVTAAVATNESVLDVARYAASRLLGI